MASINRVILLGRLTRDPELTFSQSGLQICKAGLAVNERVKRSDQWEDKSTFVDLVVFGKRGEAFSRYMAKGKAAFIEGHLSLSTWKDKETGRNRSKLEVIVDNWEFGEMKPSEEKPPARHTDFPKGPEADNASDFDIDDKVPF